MARLGEAGIEALGPARRPADFARLAGADAALELGVADRPAKARDLARLERILAPDAPILSCCQAASATGLAAALARPERLTGFALLSPWAERRTVECARARQSADWAVAGAEALWRAIGLEPVWVGDGAGLVLPRIVACLANEALFALMEGCASALDIDRAMRLGTRYPRGPLAWGELIGWPEVLATLDALAAEHGEDRYRAAPLLRQLVAAGAGIFPPPP